jgi:hypothetical protein
MLRVDSTKPCQIIYAIARHEYLSYVIEPHIVQLKSKRRIFPYLPAFILQYSQRIFKLYDDTDIQTGKILEEMEQGNLIKKFYKKPIRPFEFFTKIFNEQFLIPSAQNGKAHGRGFGYAGRKQLYLMSKEGYPAERKLQIATEPASVLFHFRRDERRSGISRPLNTRACASSSCSKMPRSFATTPPGCCWTIPCIILKKKLKGKKLLPFLNKRYIAIPRSSEQSYFEKFVIPLIEKHHVYAEGFTINTEKYDAKPILKPIYVEGGTSQLQLCFKYAGYYFPLWRWPACFGTDGTRWR